MILSQKGLGIPLGSSSDVKFTVEAQCIHHALEPVLTTMEELEPEKGPWSWL